MTFKFKQMSFCCLFLATILLFDNICLGETPYRSGKQLLAGYPESARVENGFYVAVPIDYQDLSKGTTDLYAYFRKTYDPKLPTYFLFTGGPGQSSHFPVGKADVYADVGYNFLLFDHRGIAFSSVDL